MVSRAKRAIPLGHEVDGAVLPASDEEVLGLSRVVGIHRKR